MGYLHIDNLYKAQKILGQTHCYALEKVHGTSAHIKWASGNLTFFSGGEKHDRFVQLFNAGDLALKLHALGFGSATVYGEAYGGSQQKQAWRYGDSLRFVAFDVLANNAWMTVPEADAFVRALGLRFVHWAHIDTKLANIDFWRDAPSAEAALNGVEGDKPREGVVLRPIVEATYGPNNKRLIAKHKRDEERETANPRIVGDPAKLAVIADAKRIAAEWVTQTRLEHVLDKMPGASIEHTKDVINATIEDVMREGAGELVDSPEARKHISRETAVMFKRTLQARLV